MKRLVLALFLFAAPSAALAANATYVQGTGTSGTQSGGVLTVQGDPSATPVPITCTSGCTGGGGTVSPAVGPSTDISGTVTLGGTYQTVAASSATRKSCTIQNPTTATEVLNVKLGTMASPYTLAIGASFNSGYGSDAITLTAATTSHGFAGTCQ